MRKSDIICPECGAGYRRLELVSKKGTAGEFRCRTCNHVLEVFDGSCEVAIRLTVQPENYSSEAPRLGLENFPARLA